MLALIHPEDWEEFDRLDQMWIESVMISHGHELKQSRHCPRGQMIFIDPEFPQPKVEMAA